MRTDFLREQEIVILTSAMTATQFRKLALSFADVSESAHMNHPDFRVGGRIFATLGYPDDAHGMVVLPPAEQKRLIKSHPKVFALAKGAWGKHGSTTVRLESIEAATLKAALQVAWRHRREGRTQSRKKGVGRSGITDPGRNCR